MLSTGARDYLLGCLAISVMLMHKLPVRIRPRLISTGHGSLPWVFLSLRLVDVRIRPQILEHFLTLLLVKHQIDTLTAVAALDAALGTHE